MIKFALTVFFTISIFKSGATRSIRSSDTKNICDAIVCRPGRECRVLNNGLPSCLCIESCPNHLKPICGSDGVSYDNHCLLHKAACDKQTHLSIKHKGYCKSGKEKKVLLKTPPKPVVCFQRERDLIRTNVINWLESLMQVEKTTFKHIAKRKFNECDSDTDELLDSAELLECLRKNEMVFNVKTKQQPELVGTLCIDALVEIADKDSDYLLTNEEWISFLSPKFRPPQKKCTLENKKYNDGAEIIIDCNNCICACGNWSCVSFSCDKRKPKHKAHKKGSQKKLSQKDWEKMLQELNTDYDP